MSKNITNHSDEISLKDVVLNLKEWVAYLLKYWIIISIISIIGGIVGVTYAKFQKPKYTSKITFVLEEGKTTSPSLGSLASLAGQFGVDFGNSSGGGILSGDNILLYFKSQSLAREVLLSSYDNKKSIADQYAIVYDLKNKWAKNNQIGSVNFPVLSQNSYYTRLQDSLLQSIIYTINSKHFNVARTDKKAGFIDVICIMQNEMLAKTYSERIVQKVVERYISTKTQRQNALVLKLQTRADSLAELLNKKTVSSAILQNYTNITDINPLYKTGTSVAIETNVRDKTLLSTIFANVIQNLEIAKFTLSQETPLIQIIDSPVLPLKLEKLSLVYSFIIGFLGGIFLSLFVLVSIRIYKKILIF